MPEDHRGRVRVEETAKWLRSYFGGELVIDTTDAKLVWENPHYPAYYVPLDDVRQDLLTPSERTERSPSRGTARYFNLKAGGREAPDAAWQYEDSPMEALRSLIRFEWSAMDHWFEEDEEVYVHARSPFTRVDILPSSRHVQVQIEGVTVADSVRPRLLFETTLPTRYYLPLTDVRLDLLEPSDKSTHCPYKGTASYWSVRLDDRLVPDIVWTYKTPLPESRMVAGLACFYNEKVDLIVDGVLQERPRTPFS